MKRIFGYLLSFLLGVVGCLGLGVYTFYKKQNRLNKHQPPIDYTRYTMHNVNYEAPAQKDYMDISFDSRIDAEHLLAKMKATIEKYDGLVTIADLKVFTGLRITFRDYNYGWTNLAFARVYRARDGRFYLDLPDAMPIDKD